MTTKDKRLALKYALARIDRIAEDAIREDLDIPPLKPGELCPLRAIVDIAYRAMNQTNG